MIGKRDSVWLLMTEDCVCIASSLQWFMYSNQTYTLAVADFFASLQKLLIQNEADKLFQFFTAQLQNTPQ